MGKIEFKFNNNSADNMSANHITLNEYISKPYKAVLECAVKDTNDEKGFINNTKDYINDKIYIKITQHFNSNGDSVDASDDATKTYRYVYGIVTNITYKGIYDKDTYLYEIVVQPAFAQLMKKKRTTCYSNMTVVDIIEEVLKREEYNPAIDYDISGIKFNNDDDDVIYNAKNIYIHQNNETDYDFLMRLLSYYGINYYFVHVFEDTSSNDTLKFITGMPTDKVTFMLDSILELW